MNDFAKLVCWTVPEISIDHLHSDALIAQIPQVYTMPGQASLNFLSSFNSYLTEGNPLHSVRRIGFPEYNAHLYHLLLLDMMKFVVLHEQAHVRLGHLTDKKTGWESELQADADAARILSALSAARGILPKVFGRATCFFLP